MSRTILSKPFDKGFQQTALTLLLGEDSMRAALARSVLPILIALLVWSQPVGAKDYLLFYLGGQSNMDGYGRCQELPPELNLAVQGVMIFHGNTAPDGAAVDGRGIWAELGPGHGVGYTSDGETATYSDRFGLELTFGRRLQELLPDANIAFIKYSRGGTSIDLAAAGDFGCWDPDYPGINQYDHFLAALRNAMSAGDIDGDGERDRLIPAGIVWMQGESDAFYTEGIARRYQQNLKRLVDLIRAALRTDDLPVAIGRISDSGRDDEEKDGKVWNHGEIVRSAQASVVAEDSHAMLVTSTDEYKYSDPWHYDSQGYIDLGRRFAEAIAEILDRPVAPAGSDATSEPGELTLEEKACLVTGHSSWETCPVPRLGIPAVWMADGPVGLRKSTGAKLTESVPATCFPSSSAMAATWNPELIEKLGAGIGAEARANDVTLLLAPGLNLKRHPLGGRNFEYYSEDPLLSGVTAAAFVRGVQSQGVGATLKHYAVNNQEHRRMTIDAQVDERALRELYLRGFEIAVKQGQPQAVMCAYNQVNGIPVSQNRRLLTEILRAEWGFAGLVVSDWGAVDDPAAAISAGLDLEMPGNPLTPPQIIKAVKNGILQEADLDRAVSNVLQLVTRQTAMSSLPELEISEVTAANHELGREVAIESMVLLKNDGVLPVSAGRKLLLGVIGRLAFQPRIQGIGSSQIVPTAVDTPWEHLREVGSVEGHLLDAWQEEYVEDGLTTSQLSDLAQFLERQDVALVFAGQRASHDAEAWDRPGMSLAPADLELIAAVRKAGKQMVVVLTGGGAIDVGPFDGDANAILMGWLGGQASGSAVAEVVYGHRSPSGKLSETFAHSVDDHPSSLNFPGGPLTVSYGEGLYIGYRYFQSFAREVAYPFGHGLSYTTFEYREAEAPESFDPHDAAGFDVTVRVCNSGERPGAETVQVYLRHLEPKLSRPALELVGFQKQEIAAGETQQLTIHVDTDRLAYYHDGHHRRVIEAGHYQLLVGASATDIHFTLPLEVTKGTMPRETYTLDHIIGDIIEDEGGRVIIDWLLTASGRTPLSEVEDPFFAALFKNLPLRKLSNFSKGALPIEVLELQLGLVNSDMTAEEITAVLGRAGGTDH
jgi:beta-glucosidase